MADLTRVVLIRHGESRATAEGLVHGHSCRGLTERGRRQAEALRDRLTATGELGAVDALYASEMARAVETATIIAPALGGLAIEQRCSFCEMHPGEGEGLTFDEYEQRYPMDESTWDPAVRDEPGRETWEAMAERLRVAFDELVDRHRGRTAVVVCHGGVIAHKLRRWLGVDRSSHAFFASENTGITELRFGPVPGAYGDRWQLVRFNDSSHLVGID